MDRESVGMPADVSPLAELPSCMRYKVMVHGIAGRDKRLFDEMLYSTFYECQELKLLLAEAKKKG